MRTILALALAAGLSVGGSAGAATDGAEARTHERVLDNGLKVIVREDHRAPVVVSQVWYKIGSAYEHTGITGISHVLEHMMFQGTPEHPGAEFSRIIAEQGGEENAFTSRDYTAYYQKLEKSRLPVSFELEADRMRNLTLAKNEFEREVRVVMEERRLRTEDKPSALTYEKFMATAFHVSPYHNPVIGWMDDLQHLTIDDTSGWYRTWYAPNNALVIVAGDVQPDAVFALAEKHFGPLEPSVIPEPKPRREPPQEGQRRVTVKEPAELPALYMGYKVPSLKTVSRDAVWKPYALEVAAAVLDGGNAARLSRELVRGRQIAASVGAGYDLYALNDTLFMLSGVPAGGHETDELEQALLAQIERLRNERVDQQELERIKARVTANKVYERDSVFYQAMQIGQLEAIGLDWREGERFVERIEAVTPEQVRQVAREFLHPDKITVARLEPQPVNGPAPKPKKGAVDDVVRN